MDETEALERITEPLSVSEKTTFGYRNYFARRFDLVLDRVPVADAGRSIETYRRRELLADIVVAETGC